MRRVAVTLGLTLCLLGCGLMPGPVELLTGVSGCYAGAQSPTNSGLLFPDPEYGTRFDGKGPVMWPVGYTGLRMAGGQIAVMDRSGNLVATTGKEYAFSPVPPQPGEAGQVMARVGAIPVCDTYPWDFEEVDAR